MKESKEGKEFLEFMKTKKYFILLNNIINLFYFLWSICYVDFYTWQEDYYS